MPSVSKCRKSANLSRIALLVYGPVPVRSQTEPPRDPPCVPRQPRKESRKKGASLMAIDRRAQCLAWNADHQHQRLAGQARAKTLTHEHQSRAGTASFIAFSVRMRASHGSYQLFPSEGAKYISPSDINLFGQRLPSVLQAVIHQAYVAGHPWGVEYWLLPLGVEPSFADGTLFGELDEHTWADLVPGWLVCDECWLVAICPVCQPDWWADAVITRLPHALCGTHGGKITDGEHSLTEILDPGGTQSGTGESGPLL